MARALDNKLRYLALGVGQVAEVDGLSFATQDTERLQSLVEPGSAKLALGSQPGRFVIEDDTVGAGGKAGLATIAFGDIQYYHTIVPFVDSLCRAGIHAGWGLAMHTCERQVVHGELGELAPGSVQRLAIQHLHPYP